MLSTNYYKTKIVRDLAWVIGSPPLLSNTDRSELFLPQNYFESEIDKFKNKLDDLDDNSAELINHIENGNTQLLGKYFESLVEFWLRKSEDKELLAHNLQVFKGKNTIGEFDFIYRDLTDNKVYHIECAGKFYISHRNSDQHSNFIGPNSIDNLERKVNKILTDQIRLGETEEGKEALLIEGIDEKIIPKIFLKGYLFYYSDLFFSDVIVHPDNSNPNHPKGWWIYAKDIDYFLSRRKSQWIIIKRMNWISKIIASESDDNSEMTKQLKDYFSDNNYPLLVAELQQNKYNEYEEVSRGFIVHDTWPKTEL